MLTKFTAEYVEWRSPSWKPSTVEATNCYLAQGAFEARDGTASIEWQFYGSNHGEVGGIFERNRLIGAFGASR